MSTVQNSIVYNHIDHDSEETKEERFDIHLLVKNEYPDCCENQFKQHEVYIEDPNDYALKLHEELFMLLDNNLQFLQFIR